MRNPLIETTYGVAFRKIKNKDELLFNSENDASFQLLKNSWRYWYADPIVFSDDGKDWLFVEKMDRLNRRGCISVAEINGGEIGAFTDVLNESFHLSYPMIFKKNGCVYMIPESTSGKCVNLYECKEFPHKWEYKQTLFENVLFADTNVVCQEENWYLITGEMDPKIGSKTKTLVFDANNIESGKLIPLACNAASSFSFEQRGAGSFFKNNQELIRPIQCGDENNYGKELRFTKVVIDNDCLKEKEIKRVSSDDIRVNSSRKLYGIHTYSKTDEIEIIDVKFQQFSNLPVIFSKLRRKLR